jgi:hypothetical protein
LSTTVGVPINGQVATFVSGDVAGNNPLATIDWGNGNTTAGTVVMNAGNFVVLGENTYAAAGTFNVIVTVTGTGDTTASGLGQVMVAPTLTGQLDPLSDTGASNADGVTAINQPTFIGTAQPYAIVSLFGRRSDQAQPVFLGQAITSPVGSWNLSAGALPDGVYSFTVQQTPPTGLPTNMVAVTPASLIIDTVPPAAVIATAGQGSSEVSVVLKDNLSGLNPATVTNPGNYALLGPHGSRFGPASATILPYPTVRASNPITVVLHFNAGVKLKKNMTIALGGITDLAGNRIPREYIKVTLVSLGHAVVHHSGRALIRPHQGRLRV